MSGETAAQDLTKLDPNSLNKEFEEMGIDPKTFEALEKDFHQVLDEMLGDKSLERFRNEYEKLHRALKTSYESEKRLVNRCKELNNMIITNAARVKSAIMLTQQDSQTIGTLKKEVDKAWRMIDLAKEKEEKARKIIQELRSEIVNLNKIVEHGSGLSIGQDNTVHNLMRQKDDLKKECDQKQERIGELEGREAALQEQVHKKESEVVKKEEEISELKKQLTTQVAQSSRDTRKIKTLDGGQEVPEGDQDCGVSHPDVRR